MLIADIFSLQMDSAFNTLIFPFPKKKSILNVSVSEINMDHSDAICQIGRNIDSKYRSIRIIPIYIRSSLKKLLTKHIREFLKYVK